MLFLISSAPGTDNYSRTIKLAEELNAKVCLLQNAVYGAREKIPPEVYVIGDDLRLRGVGDDEVFAKVIDYGELVDIMLSEDRVIGCF